MRKQQLVETAPRGAREVWVCPLSPEQLTALDKALSLIRQEVIRAAWKHGGRPFASPHEAYGVLLEEVDEFWDEIKANNMAASLDEVVQVGAMAAYFVTSFARTPVGTHDVAPVREELTHG